MKTLLFGVLFLISCSSDAQKSTKKTIFIEPYMSVQNGWSHVHLGIRSTNSSADYISGFEFVWGYSYELKIKKTKLRNPPMDASSVKYSLIKVVSKTKVAEDYEFKMLLERDLYLGAGEQVNNFVAIDDSTFRYLDKIEIEVPEKLMEKFNKVMVDGESKNGVFVFVDETKIRLIRIE